MKTAFVYYSRTGDVRKEVSRLAEALGGDVIEIKAKGIRRGPIGFVLCGFEAARGSPADIEQSSCKLSAYDVTVIATPVWAGRISSPMRTFLARHGGDIKRAAYLISHSAPNNDYGDVIEELSNLISAEKVAECSFTPKAQDKDDKLMQFALAVKSYETKCDL